MNYWKTFTDGYRGYANYLWQEISNPGWHNYFYWLLLVSVFFFALEWFSPWRKDQPRFRKDFWLDFFYMFFNFFLFSLIIYNAASMVVVNFFNATIQSITGFDLQASNPLRNFPAWAILLIGFFVRDFIQWWVHRLLHWSPALWEFHKVHHSVEQMGFAAHLRYHWMENVVYRSIEYIPLALLGIGLYDFFIIHVFALSIGHYNHSNISVPGYVTGGVLGGLIGIVFAAGILDVNVFPHLIWWQQALVILGGIGLGSLIFGPVMKIVFNSPEMHIWHHAHDMPEDMPNGINFGISLAMWDYLFGTARMPHNGRDIKLGFPGMEQFPKGFVAQNLHGLGLSEKRERQIDIF